MSYDLSGYDNWKQTMSGKEERAIKTEEYVFDMTPDEVKKELQDRDIDIDDKTVEQLRNDLIDILLNE